ncbi:MAG: formylglycine-generating enzyme family protein [Desulforegulaceae bacterium]|nr:formylglycine-generating enzyme family protein [Desulforegulaceae bacterium]
MKKINFLFLIIVFLIPGYSFSWFENDFEPVWQDSGSGFVSSEDKFTNFLGMEFVYIKPGTFMMGSPSSESGRYDHEKQHKVTLTKGFFMQTTEVTQAQWKKVMGNNPSDFKNCGDNCPVENVSWYGAKDFIRKLNNKDKNFTYRLPTEAEWEYAARGGTTTPFYLGNCLSTKEANYDGNYPLSGCSKGQYRKTTIPVKSFSPNKFGLYDMHGNVWEWCEDWKGDYPSGHVTDPSGPGSGSYRVLRGGSWSYDARSCRSANRYYFSPGYTDDSRGFRLAAFRGRH